VPNLGLVLELEKQVIHGIDLPEENAWQTVYAE
jgi:hypothetical protein